MRKMGKVDNTFRPEIEQIFLTKIACVYSDLK